MKRVRMYAWLVVGDVLRRLGLFGSPLHLWTIGCASSCVDWDEFAEYPENAPW